MSLVSLVEAKEIISEGGDKGCFLISGEEALLKELPKGHWIGGTIPYFMTETGAKFSKESIYITQLPPSIKLKGIEFYNEENIQNIGVDAAPHGVSFIIIPGSSRIHYHFAKNVSSFKDIFSHPLIGWIAGVDLSKLHDMSPKVINGQKGEILENSAVVLHTEVNPNIKPKIDIINIFGPKKNSDILTFDDSGFEMEECFVNGEKKNFAEYLMKNNIDIKMPLVANYSGTTINCSFQEIDQKNNKVILYAPVFKGVEYRFASPIKDYIEEFSKKIKNKNIVPIFSCNCILNYLYASLEGKSTEPFMGPITFGEVAYVLLNQTLAYLELVEK